MGEPIIHENVAVRILLEIKDIPENYRQNWVSGLLNMGKSISDNTFDDIMEIYEMYGNVGNDDNVTIIKKKK